jgi:diguanylate cyclase (GGDEF)-like protein
VGDYEALYRQYMQLGRQVDHLSILREIGLAISGSLDLAETLREIAEVVHGALDVRRFTLYTLDKDTGALRPVIAKLGNDLITQERLQEDSEARRGTPFGEALDTRTAVIRETFGRQEAYVPLIAKNEPLGVMLLQEPQDGSPFDPDDAALFQQLGSQIALAIHNARLYAMAVTDGLTGLYVRRYFDLRMQEEFAEAQRYRRPFALLMFDIDRFKNFNDTHGHQTGDLVLKQFAKLLQDNTRRSDICCRYGGEEMTVILPGSQLREAAQLAEKLCALVRNNLFRGADNQILHVTTSIGVAEFLTALSRPEAMVEAVDKALYRAKESGRDQVVLAE